MGCATFDSMCKDERKALNNKEQPGMFTVADKIKLNKILRNLKNKSINSLTENTKLSCSF